jgi:very-short-patch-repair endonuclease
MGAARATVDAIIGAIAAQQHGVVGRDQLLAAGVTRSMIRHRIASGMLVPVYDGVYLVGHGPPSPRAALQAAVLACRPRALLAGRTAARAFELPAREPDTIEVTVVGRTRHSFANVRVRKLDWLPRRELHHLEGIPISSPSLTLMDVAGHGDADELIGCLHEARVKEVVTDEDLRATLAAHPNRRGARSLRALLQTEGGVRLTRSPAERRALKVMRRHGLEPDASDHPVGPYRLDFYFERERVAVEYDGRATHDNPKRFVQDRRKIAYLAARGILTVPLTAHDVGAGATRAMADLRATLESRRA